MNKPRNMNQKNSKGILFWLASVIIIIFLWSLLSDVSKSREIELKFSDFMEKVESKAIIDAEIDSNTVIGKMRTSGNMDVVKYKTAIPASYQEFIPILRKLKANPASRSDFPTSNQQPETRNKKPETILWLENFSYLVN